MQSYPRAADPCIDEKRTLSFTHCRSVERLRRSRDDVPGVYDSVGRARGGRK
jgi:hypothetical protein